MPITPGRVAGVLAAVVSAAALAPSAQRTVRGPKRTMKSGETAKLLQAVKLLYARRQYRDAVQCAYVGVWDDIKHPEVLRYLVMALERLAKKEDAAAFTHILQSVLEDAKYKTDARAKRWRAWCTVKLRTLDVQFRKDQAKYLAGAAERKFTSPSAADDLWMTQVRCDLRGLHGLYAWKLVGGRKDAKKDWIHNTQGRMHRSGAKYMDDVHGRKGVLFTVPSKKSKRLSRLIIRNHGKGKVLRIGVRAYNFSFVLNVKAGEEQLFSKTVDKKRWEDVQVPLGPEAAKQAEITLELVVPEKQRWSEGVFFDYVDFFQD